MFKSASKYAIRIMAFVMAFAMLPILSACDSTGALNNLKTFDQLNEILQEQLTTDLKLRGFSDISKASYGNNTVAFSAKMGNCKTSVVYARLRNGRSQSQFMNQVGFPCDRFHCVYSNNTFGQEVFNDDVWLPRLSLDGIDVFGADATYDHIHGNVKIYQRANPDIINCFPDLT